MAWLERLHEKPGRHLVADRKLGNPLADGGHDSGKVAALARRKGGRKAGVQGTASDGRLTRIDARRLDGHHDLTRSGDWHRDGRDIEDVPISIPVETHRT